MESGDHLVLEPLLDNIPDRTDRNVSDIIERINPKNAKRVAIFLILFFTAYHGYVHLRYGKDTCRWLLSDGHFKRDMSWQPYGCMMHTYSKINGNHCMRLMAFSGLQNTFAFVGDHRIKNMYEEFKSHFANEEKPSDKKPVKNLNSNPFAVHSNSSFSDSVLRLRADYYWEPYISQSLYDLLSYWQKSDESPKFIILGCGTWSIRASGGSAESLNDYSYNITRLLRVFKKVCPKSRILWVLQAPFNEDKLNISNAIITNEIIDKYNEAAMKVLEPSCVELWSSARLITQGRLEATMNGIELDTDSLDIEIQLLLNVYCNDCMNQDDGTCCSTSEPMTVIQLIAFVALSICLICGILLKVFPVYTCSSYFLNLRTVIGTLAKLALIMIYFYLCDRTNFFMKENKYYSNVSFWLPLGYVFTLGLFFTEESRYTKLLNRDQTDEWKGWMLCVILIYQMTGASEQLPIYNHILLLSGAYLFLSGYGHFTYLWFRNDAGILRMLHVLFRLNFLTVILCFCMNRPYQFYFFIPVVTFWFLLFFVVFIFPPRITATSSDARPIQYIFILMKVLFLFVSICILYMSQIFFEKLFVTRPWKALFVTTDDDIEHWWFNWKIGRFSFLYGIIFAVFLFLTQKYNLIDDNNHNNLFSARVSFFAAVLAFLGLLATSVYAILCQNRLEFIDIQAYIVFIPIVCYIILRNVSGILRTRYSTVFAFFGRISLELYVSHFHIWLAADSNGILVFIPQYPVLNALVVAYIYVCISFELHNITKKLLPYAVPNDRKAALRNLLMFVLILIPVGIRDGMF